MSIKTYDDCVNKSKEVGISAEKIARAFSIDVPEKEMDLEERLKYATSQKQRWGIYHKANGNKIKKMVLKEIEKQCKIDLNNASTQTEKWLVFFCAPDKSRTKKEALKMIFDNSTSQVEKRKVYLEAPEESPIQKSAIRALCS